MRVKTGPTRRRRHKKVLARVKGARLSRSKHYKVAKETDLHKGQHEYIGRKLRKRDLRRLWITRINAGLKAQPKSLSYSKFIALLKKTPIDLNRKMLAHLAAKHPETFKQVVNTVHG